MKENTTGPTKQFPKRCEIWACVYHACMSPECQHEAVTENGGDFGEKLCEFQENEELKINN